MVRGRNARSETTIFVPCQRRGGMGYRLAALLSRRIFARSANFSSSSSSSFSSSSSIECLNSMTRTRTIRLRLRRAWKTGAQYLEASTRRRRRQPEIIRMIRTAHERPAGNVRETQFFRGPRVFGKRRGRDELDHRQVIPRRLQTLAQRENVATDATQIRHG